MLLYPDHLQNWLDYGHSLVIFLILVLFWLSETGQIWGFQAFSGKPIEEMAWNFECWCILTTFRIDKIMVFRTCGSKCRGEGGGIFPTLCVECCLVYNVFSDWLRLLSHCLKPYSAIARKQALCKVMMKSYDSPLWVKIIQHVNYTLTYRYLYYCICGNLVTPTLLWCHNCVVCVMWSK